MELLWILVLIQLILMFKLKRVSANDTDDINELSVKASGLWAFIKTRISKEQKIGQKINIRE